MLNAPDTALHQLVVATLAREVVGPFRRQRRTVEVGDHSLQQRLPTAVGDGEGDEAAQRQRVGGDLWHGGDDAVDTCQCRLLLYRDLIEHQVAVNLRLAAHLQIVVVFLPVGGSDPGGILHILIFRIQPLKLAVLLGTGAGHVEAAVARTEEIPAVDVVDVAVVVVVDAIGTLLGIGPQGFGHGHARRVDAGVDNADDKGLAKLEVMGLNEMVEANDVGTFQRVVVLLMPTDISTVVTYCMEWRRVNTPPYAQQSKKDVPALPELRTHKICHCLSF